MIAAPPPAPPAAFAAPRTPDAQARLGELAETLGRAHALHRRCAGPADDRWRAPMQRLLQVEAATPALRDRLVARFNAGFAAAGARFRTCSPATRAALRSVAAAGRELARGLGGSDVGAPP